MSRTVADVIVETLERAGAKRCYGVPGDTLNYVTDSIRRSGIRWVHVRHEEAGAFAAGADALLTDQLALCAGSCGPGSLHFVNGIRRVLPPSQVQVLDEPAPPPRPAQAEPTANRAIEPMSKVREMTGASWVNRPLWPNVRPFFIVVSSAS